MNAGPLNSIPINPDAGAYTANVAAIFEDSVGAATKDTQSFNSQTAYKLIEEAKTPEARRDLYDQWFKKIHNDKAVRIDAISFVEAFLRYELGGDASPIQGDRINNVIEILKSYNLSYGFSIRPGETFTLNQIATMVFDLNHNPSSVTQTAPVQAPEVKFEIPDSPRELLSKFLDHRQYCGKEVDFNNLHAKTGDGKKLLIDEFEEIVTSYAQKELQHLEYSHSSYEKAMGANLPHAISDQTDYINQKQLYTDVLDKNSQKHRQALGALFFALLDETDLRRRKSTNDASSPLLDELKAKTQSNCLTSKERQNLVGLLLGEYGAWTTTYGDNKELVYVDNPSVEDFKKKLEDQYPELKAPPSSKWAEKRPE